MKLLLALAGFAFCCWLGFRRAAQYGSRVATLSSLRDYLLFLQAAVSEGNMTYREMLQSYRRQNSPLGLLCHEMLLAWQAAPKSAPGILWQNCLQHSTVITGLKKTDLLLLAWLGEKGEEGFPQGCFSYGLEQAHLLHAEALAERAASTRMFSSLGVLAGLAYIILIL